MRNCVRKFNTLSKIGRKRNSQLLLNSPPKYSKGTLNITHCNAFTPKSSSLLDLFYQSNQSIEKSRSYPQFLPFFNLLYPVGKLVFEKSITYFLSPLLLPWPRPPTFAFWAISTLPPCLHHSNLSCRMLAEWAFYNVKLIYFISSTKKSLCWQDKI